MCNGKLYTEEQTFIAEKQIKSNMFAHLEDDDTYYGYANSNTDSSQNSEGKPGTKKKKIKDSKDP